MNPYVRPLGVGDLLITKQRLVRYELGEIAHVENVMARELRSREHVRRQVTETVTEEETEQVKESEDELQTTERFETKAEVEQVVRAESSMSAGIDITATYGPVSVSAFGNFSSSSSSEDSRRSATQYSKETIEKAVSRIQDRVRKKRLTRVVEEIVESNKHEFNNTLSGDHRAGVYRWIDKYYLNKVVNYGKRLMLEFMVPEPAAFFAFSSNPEIQGSLPLRPTPPRDPLTNQPLEIAHIQPHTYLAIAGQYGFENVQPPPRDLTFVSTGTAKKWTQQDQIAYVIEDLEVPEGYYAWILAIRHTGGTQYTDTMMSDDSSVYWVRVGSTSYHVARSYQFPYILLEGQTGRLPVVFNGVGVSNQGVSTTLWCRPMRVAMEKWQLSTYTAIMSGYRQALQDYEEKMAALAIQAGVRIQGNNPAINRQIEKEELKRGCIGLLRLQDLDMPHAVQQDTEADHPANYPRTVFANAILNGYIAQFFEEGFEWNNITYEFLPYFWGRRPEWINSIASKNNDPVFERFLQAGMAKVRVPVNAKWSKSILFYLMTGRMIIEQRLIPRLSELSHPAAELYNSYVEDLADEVEVTDIAANVVIDPLDQSVWETKVPTNLVYLQAENSFPIAF